MSALYRFIRLTILLASVCAVGLVGYAYVASRPQDLPWTSLDMNQPVGLFTGRKLTALGDDRAGCLALLDRAGVGHSLLDPGGNGQCGYDDAVRLTDDPGSIALTPADVAPSCPVVAALKLWEWQVVQPAAERIYGQGVTSISHFGAYSCRRLYGRSQGDFSEHATANAIDVSSFTIADGRRVTVAADWNGAEQDRRFLREVRDGACDLFATVLSPDYNQAHADHFHLDQANRGAGGWRACR